MKASKYSSKKKILPPYCARIILFLYQKEKKAKVWGIIYTDNRYKYSVKYTLDLHGFHTYLLSISFNQISINLFLTKRNNKHL